MRTVGEVAWAVTVGFCGLSVIEQSGWIGIFVDAINRRFHSVFENFRNGLVCRQHAFLNELVALCVNDGICDLGTTLVVEADFNFRHFQVERAVGEASGAHRGCERPAFFYHSDKFRVRAFWSGFTVENCLCLLVGKFRTTVDHGIDEDRFADLSGKINF